MSLFLPFTCEALLFDLDDTLYDRDAAYRKWATTFVYECFPDIDSYQAQMMVDLLVQLDEHEDAPRDLLFTQFQSRYPSLDVPVATLVEVYHQQFPLTIKPSEEVQIMLHKLKEASIPFGIVTNGSYRQLRKIEILGLNHLTSCIFVSHLFGKEKPDPAIFLAAADSLQTRPESILFVGDNPYNDIWGAHRVGMRTVWFQRAHIWPATLPPHIADLTIHSLNDLLLQRE